MTTALNRLAASRTTAATAAVVAFVAAKNPRRKNRDRGASILNPALNPDLRDDLVDLVADVLIWAKAQGLDPAYIARVGLSHTGSDALADDRNAHGAA